MSMTETQIYPYNDISRPIKKEFWKLQFKLSLKNANKETVKRK